jgi:hypothetical protein
MTMPPRPLQATRNRSSLGLRDHGRQPEHQMRQRLARPPRQPSSETQEQRTPKRYVI